MRWFRAGAVTRKTKHWITDGNFQPHALTSGGKGARAKLYKESWTRDSERSWVGALWRRSAFRSPCRWPCPQRAGAFQHSLCRFSTGADQGRERPAGRMHWVLFKVSDFSPKVLPAFMSPQIAAFWAEAILSMAMSFSGAGTGFHGRWCEEASQIRLF